MIRVILVLRVIFVAADVPAGRSLIGETTFFLFSSVVRDLVQIATVFSNTTHLLFLFLFVFVRRTFRDRLLPENSLLMRREVLGTIVDDGATNLTVRRIRWYHRLLLLFHQGKLFENLTKREPTRRQISRSKQHSKDDMVAFIEELEPEDGLEDEDDEDCPLVGSSVKMKFFPDNESKLSTSDSTTTAPFGRYTVTGGSVYCKSARDPIDEKCDKSITSADGLKLFNKIKPSRPPLLPRLAKISK